MPPKILIIDDSKLIHQLVADGLCGDEVECLHAHDADQGFWFAVRSQPDLILLDVIMPRASGFELCRALKNDPKTSQIPIIFLSGAADSTNKVQGLDLGAMDFITKPFEMSELQARVRAGLRIKSLIDLLAETAQVDALTKLRNRRFFDQRLEEELAAVRRFGRAVGLILLDVDEFKQANDRLGHLFGDQALQALGSILTAALRECDVACRYGGEEFAVICSDAETSGVAELAERLRAAIERMELRWRGAVHHITVSCGVAASSQFQDRRSLTSGQLKQAADAALYAAKQGGRNRAVVATGTMLEGSDENLPAPAPPLPARPIWDELIECE